MLKKTITYTDYNGESRTEDFYFNLTKAELIQLELGTKGGFTESLEKIIESNDGTVILSTFQEIILKAYGEKSADGRRFIKNDALREEFSQTEAYSELFVELATDAEAGAKFVQGLIPATLAKEVEKELLERKRQEVEKAATENAHQRDLQPLPSELIPKPSEQELQNMSREDLIRLAAQGKL